MIQFCIEVKKYKWKTLFELISFMTYQPMREAARFYEWEPIRSRVSSITSKAHQKNFRNVTKKFYVSNIIDSFSRFGNTIFRWIWSSFCKWSKWLERQWPRNFTPRWPLHVVWINFSRFCFYFRYILLQVNGFIQFVHWGYSQAITLSFWAREPIRGRCSSINLKTYHLKLF